VTNHPDSHPVAQRGEKNSQRQNPDISSLDRCEDHPGKQRVPSVGVGSTDAVSTAYITLYLHGLEFRHSPGKRCNPRSKGLASDAVPNSILVERCLAGVDDPF